MAGDFLQSQGVKTQRDNEFKIKVVDGASGTTATKVMTVADVGDTVSAGTNDFGVVPLAKGSDNLYHSFSCDTAGRLNVVIVSTATMTPVNDYATADVVNGTPGTHDKVVTTGKTATLIVAQVASLGLMRWDLGTFDGSVFTPLVSRVTEPASPSATLTLQPSFPVVGNGTLKIRLVITNLELTSEAAYHTLQYIEQ